MEICGFVSPLYQPYLPSITDLYISSTFFAAGPGLSASFLLEFSCLQEKKVDFELDFSLDFQTQSLPKYTVHLNMQQLLPMFLVGMHFFLILNTILIL